jgi:hypothetical protein
MRFYRIADNNGRDLSQSSFYPASYRLPNLIPIADDDLSANDQNFSDKAEAEISFAND